MNEYLARAKLTKCIVPGCPVNRPVLLLGAILENAMDRDEYFKHLTGFHRFDPQRADDIIDQQSKLVGYPARVKRRP